MDVLSLDEKKTSDETIFLGTKSLLSLNMACKTYFLFQEFLLVTCFGSIYLCTDSTDPFVFVCYANLVPFSAAWNILLLSFSMYYMNITYRQPKTFLL